MYPPKLRSNERRQLKALDAPLQKLCELVGEQVERGKHGARVEYTRFSGALQEAAQAVEVAAHGCALGVLDVDADAITINGELYRKAGRNPGTYNTKSGPVAVPRSIYRKAALPNEGRLPSNLRGCPTIHSGSRASTGSRGAPVSPSTSNAI